MTESIKSLLKRCQEAGLRLSLIGANNDQLNVEFDQAPSQEMLAALKVNKAELLTHLISLQQNKAKDLSALTIKKLHHDGAVSLSWQQQSMYFVGALQDDSSNYNMVKAYRYEGSFCPDTAVTALKKLIALHPVLNIEISASEGLVSQRFNSVQNIVDSELVISVTPRGGRETDFSKEVEKIWQLEQNHKFAYLGQPLLRLIHLRGDKNSGVILFNLHHLVADGISIAVLLTDFIRHYQESYGLEKVQVNQQKCDINYFDYVLWQQSKEASDAVAGQLAFWRERLKEAPQLHQLPLDFPRPAVKTTAGRSYHHKLNAHQVQSLKAFARLQGITPFILLHSVFALLIARYSNQSDILIGTPTAGREHPQLSKLVGLLTNTVALRSNVDSRLTVQEFLAQNKQDLLTALAHSDISFDKVIEVVNPQRSVAYSPLIQIMFSVETHDSSEIQLPSLTLTQLEQEETSTKFDLDLMVKLADGEMTLRFNYDPHLFKRNAIKSLASNFVRLLQLVQSDPQQSIAQLPLVNEAQITALVKQFATLPEEKKPVSGLAELFEIQAVKYPENIAISDENSRLSYAELDRQANKVAQYLVSADIPGNSLVAIGYGRNCHAVVAMLGVLKAGCAYVPVDPALPKKRLDFIVQDSKAAYLLTDTLSIAALADKSCCVTSIIGNDALAATAPDIAIDRTDLAYIIYTSGSTGIPKGVMVEQGNVQDLLTGCQAKFQFTSDDRFSVFHSTSFDVSVWEIYTPLSCGATACLVSESLSKDPRAFAHWLLDKGISVLSQTPSVFYEVSGELAQLLENVTVEGADADNSNAKGTLRYVVLAGEALDNSRLSSWFSAPCTDAVTLVNMYGTTETTVHVTWQQVTNTSSNSIGTALPGYQTFVVSTAGQIQPDNVPGELLVAGCGVTRGYLHRDNVTQERFLSRDLGTGIQRFYKTGDVVKRDPKGHLHYLGRIDQQIKIRGFRIEPGEIEKRLCQLKEIELAAVEKASLASGEQLVAFVTGVTPDLAQRPLAQLCRSELSRHLPHYMVPSRFVLVQSFPVTSNGKIDRKKLLSLLTEQPQDASTAMPQVSLPVTGTQIKLAAIWTDLLNVSNVTLRDDFFAMGGHSLLVTRLITSIEQQWHLKVTLKQAFINQELAQMAQLIDEMLATKIIVSEQPAIQKIKAGQTALASMAQQSLWLACQKDNNTSKYNIPVALKLMGSLNLNALQNALQTILERHDSLRMTFHLSSDNQLQVKLLDSAIIDVTVQDFSQCTGTSSDAVARSGSVHEFLAEEAQTSFDLATDLPIRARVLRSGSKEHVLLLTLHHIAADGWSLDILMKEFSELYNGNCLSQASKLADLSVGYLDFAHWQRNQVTEAQMQQDLQYWQAQLKDCPRNHSLPLDNPANHSEKRQAGVWQQTLPKAQYQQLHSLASQQHCSVFSALQAALGLFIAMTSNQSDVLVGSPVAQRNSVQLQGLMGLFVNTLVFRHKVSAKQSFIDLLQNTQQQLLDGSNHLSAPFDYVVSNLQTDLCDGRLCQIVLNFIGNKFTDTTLHQLTWQNISDEFQIADLDLHLTARETDEGLGIRWLFASDILQNRTIETWAEQFAEMLDWLCHHPQTAISQMSFASLDDYANANPGGEGESDAARESVSPLVHKKVEQMAAGYPKQLALWWQEDGEECKLTYQALNSQANQLARFLHSKGVTVGDRVGICLPRGGHFVLAMLAIQKLGASFVCMGSENPYEHLNYIAENADIKAVVTQQSLLQHFDFLTQYPMALMEPAFREVLLGKLPEHNLCEVANDKSYPLAVYIIYTSGTSGKPKGVSVDHSALSNLIEHEVTEFALTSDSRVIHSFSMSFDPGVGHLFSALSAGAQVYVCPLRDDVAAFIQRHQLTHASLPTALLSTIKPQRFDSLQLLSVGGEYCPESLAKTWSKCNRFLNLYGPTEATVYALYKEFTAEQGISIGRPVANTRCFIVNQFGQMLPQGQAGELVITGAAIGTHYINNEEANQNSYFQLNAGGRQLRAYRTGDMAMFDGEFHYLGRIDKQLKIRGYRIEPTQIEQQMMQYLGLEKAFVTSYQRGNKQPLLLGYFSAMIGQSIDVERLMHHLRQILPAYCVPEVLMEIESFPVTLNGKIDEQALPEPQLQTSEFVAPQNALELAVKEMWQRILELDSLSMSADFFDVGGNSLMAMMMVTEVKSRFGVEIGVMDVFNAKSPASMAALISEKQATDGYQTQQQADDADAIDEDNNVEMEW